MDQEEIEQRLKELSGWQLQSEKLCLFKVVRLKNFMAAVEKMNQVAAEAELQNHHPDMFLKNYSELSFQVMTHSEGNLTEKDFKLARAIDRCLQES